MPNMEISKLLIRKLEDAMRSEDPIDYVEEMILPQFSWNDVQDALIYILLDDNHEDKDYANSEFNPLMDPNILETLSEYGITII